MKEILDNHFQPTHRPHQARFGLGRDLAERHSKGTTRHSATVGRTYYDADDNPKSTGSFGRDELLTLAKVADPANTRIHELLAQQRDREKQANGTAS